MDRAASRDPTTIRERGTVRSPTKLRHSPTSIGGRVPVSARARPMRDAITQGENICFNWMFFAPTSIRGPKVKDSRLKGRASTTA